MHKSWQNPCEHTILCKVKHLFPVILVDYNLDQIKLFIISDLMGTRLKQLEPGLSILQRARAQRFDSKSNRLGGIHLKRTLHSS